MKYLISLILIVALIVGGLIFFSNHKKSSRVTDTTSSTTANINSKDTNPTDTAPKVVAKNLNIPWAITVLPNNSLLVTQRGGMVSLIEASGNVFQVGLINVKQIGEGGLLGIALDPDFSKNSYVYIYYTYSGNGSDILNKVSRFSFKDNKLANEKIIINNIPGNSNHDGGRIKFGPDNYLYIGTGDAQNPSQAQNKNTLGGKILRVTKEGKVPSDNPFGNAVYSYGHRNVQGLTWDKKGNLWATEHGRSGVLSGLDEINLIEEGKNYGWPTIQGDETKANMETPKKNSDGTTWAPSGAVFVGNSLFFTGLRGQALYEAVINGTEVVGVKEHLKNQYGRIRDVVLGSDGMLYISTSNKDGRGSPTSDDDVVVKINPKNF